MKWSICCTLFGHQMGFSWVNKKPHNYLAVRVFIVAWTSFAIFIAYFTGYFPRGTLSIRPLPIYAIKDIFFVFSFFFPAVVPSNLRVFAFCGIFMTPTSLALHLLSFSNTQPVSVCSSSPLSLWFSVGIILSAFLCAGVPPSLKVSPYM